MEADGTWRNFAEPCRMLRNVVEHDGTRWNMMEGYGTSENVLESGHIRQEMEAGWKE
jgi:hypothetical protein